MVLRQTAIPDEGILHFIPAYGRNVEEPEIKKVIQKSSDELLQIVNKKLKELIKQAQTSAKNAALLGVSTPDV